MKLDSKDKEGRMWILEQMDWLEQVKKAHAGNEAIAKLHVTTFVMRVVRDMACVAQHCGME